MAMVWPVPSSGRIVHAVGRCGICGGGWAGPFRSEQFRHHGVGNPVAANRQGIDNEVELGVPLVG